MAEGGGGSVAAGVPTLPPPRPKSPPDLYGKRRGLARVQMLDREISYLEGELKFVESLPPASRCCKEVADFVVASSDPFMPSEKTRRSCSLWKWLCRAPCLLLSSICCFGCHLKKPRCCNCKMHKCCPSCVNCSSCGNCSSCVNCSLCVNCSSCVNCSCGNCSSCINCSLCVNCCVNCSSCVNCASCVNCSMPKCQCCPCPWSQCLDNTLCKGKCCLPRCFRCPDCSCKCRFSCPKVNLCCCCTSNCWYSCWVCY